MQMPMEATRLLRTVGNLRWGHSHMQFSHWLRGLSSSSDSLQTSCRSNSCARKKRSHRNRQHVPIECLESRQLLSADFADAIDLTSGIGLDDYQTLLANNGPRHEISGTRTTLFLGAHVDAEADATPTQTARGDDRASSVGFTQAAADVPLPIDDVGIITSHLVVAGRAGFVSDVNVLVDIEHPFDGQLVLTLVSPAGTRVALTNHNGGAGQNFSSTVFDDDSSNALASGAAPFEGVFRPVGDLNAFENEPLNGDWQLEVADEVAGESGTLLSWSLTFATLPNDEDGLVEPEQDLVLTTGTQPVVRVRATNETGNAATLFGWIDINRDGQFDNDSERTSVAIPIGTVGQIFTVTFPTIPDDAETGATVARFRLSTDSAAEDSTGFATDGEVEDHAAFIRRPSNGSLDPRLNVKIGSERSGGPLLANSDFFGSAVASLGDFDGDGVNDLLVGADRDDTGGVDRGAVYVLTLNPDGTAKGQLKIGNETNGLGTLADNDGFGSAVTSLDDLDGDGVTDIAVGASVDDTNGTDRGAVYVLTLHPDGSVKSSLKLASGMQGVPTLANGDFFGRSLTSIGDLDGDGLRDLVVGASGTGSVGGYDRGAVYVLLLNADGSVKHSTTIAHQRNGGPSLGNSDYFGASVASLGDLDGDGISELAVGATGDDTSGSATPGNGRGAVHVLHLKSDGTVLSSVKIASATNDGPALQDSDGFGSSLTSVGDLDGDGVADLVVGAAGDDTEGHTRGALHVLTLNADGSVKGRLKLASGSAGTPLLADYDRFGGAIASLGDLNGDGVAELAVGAVGDDTGGVLRGAVHVMFPRPLYSFDYGDAPDTSTGASAGNYQTFADDQGPSHDLRTTRTTLFLGQRVEGDADAEPNIAATGDDVAIAYPDEEDGIIDPYQLQLTAGRAPSVQLRATNQTGAAATLFGWIDINRNGVFENDTERASVGVPSGTTNGLLSLTFPTIATTFSGATYARFRLSTDSAAGNSIGAASDGEVEDYAATILQRSDGTANSAKNKKLASGANGTPTLANFDEFGTSVTSIGDLNGDGIPDVAVGASQDDTGGTGRGAVHLLFLNANGSVKQSVKLASETRGVPALGNSSYFGSSIASLGDIDGDGVVDLAVGSPGNNTGGAYRGAVHVLLMTPSGSVRRAIKIAHNTNGGPELADGDFFGSSVTGLSDLDGDGVSELVVGADRDDTGGTNRGAAYVLTLNRNGTVKRSTKIAHQLHGGPQLANGDNFGRSVTALGRHANGTQNIAIGATGDDSGGDNRGAVYVVRLNSDGSVGGLAKLAQQSGSPISLANGDAFGTSLARVGDLDGDGVTDLAVGAIGDDTGGTNRGAVHLVLLNDNGSAKNDRKLASNTNGTPTLADGDFFGRSVAAAGDLDGDGVIELAVGASGDDTNGAGRGAVHVQSLKPFTLPAVSVVASRPGVLEDGSDVVEFTFARSGFTTDALTVSFNVGGNATYETDYSVTGATTFSGTAGTITFAPGAATTRLVVDPTGDSTLETNETVTLTLVASTTVRLAEPNAATTRVVNDEAANVRVDLAGRLVLTDLSGRNDRLSVTFDSATQQVIVRDTANALTTAVGTQPNVREVRVPLTEITQRSLLATLQEGDDSLSLASLAASVFSAGTNLDGGNGQDTIEGSAGADSIEGGSGSDSIVGGTGLDTLSGSAGNDSLTSTSTTGVSILGGSGNDSIRSGAGNDTIMGSTGADQINSGAGNDVIYGGSDNDTIDAGVGNDTASGQDGDDSIIGGDGDDALQGGDGADVLDGGNGSDRLFGGINNDRLIGGGDHDSLWGDSGDDSLAGDDGNDQLRGGAGTDDLDGGLGNDRVSEEADTNFVIIGLQLSSPLTGTELTRSIERFNLSGGAGANLIDGRRSSVVLMLNGNDGNDTLFGGPMNDVINGGSGADVVSGGAGEDVIDGGSGIDFLYEQADADFTVNGLQVSSSVTGTETPTSIERIALVGGASHNRIDASASAVRVILLGGRGNDTLIGGGLQDILDGGGPTIPVGESGQDNLDGRGSVDTYALDPNDTFALEAIDQSFASLLAVLPTWLHLGAV